MALGRCRYAGRGGRRGDALQSCGVGRSGIACRRPSARSMRELTVRAIRAVAVEVPLRFVLGTSAAAVRAAPLLLVDVETEEGITGRTYLFCYVRAAAPGIAAMLNAVEEAVRGTRVSPAATWAMLAKRYRLIGVQGVVRMAMAAFDTACW